MLTPDELDELKGIARKLLNFYFGPDWPPDAARDLVATLADYGDERAHEMKERCALAMASYQDIVDEARRKAGYANSPDLAAIIRALDI